MIHMRIVAPHDCSQQVLDMFSEHESVTNVVHLPDAAKRPHGDVILVDVAREDASVIISDLRELEIPERGSIAIEEIDTEISEASKRAEKAAAGAVSDAVVWEEIEARTSETAELSWSFVAFMVLATVIASVGILTDSPILIVGAMVVGPEFGPIAGFCVAVVQRRAGLAARSFVALAVGFPTAITVTWLCVLAYKALGISPDVFSESDHQFASIISSPDFFTFFVAFCAGVAGVLSLTTAKSGALIGVLISVTTIPAAANIAVSFAYQDWEAWRGSMLQLAINIASLLFAGVLVLGIQRFLYRRRRLKHLGDPIRTVAGLPVGHSRRGSHMLKGNALRRAHEAAEKAAKKREAEAAEQAAAERR